MFATASGSIKLWDAQNYTQYQEIPSVNGRVTGITWTQNGQCIASIGENVPEISLLAVNAKSTANIGVVRGVESPSCLQFPCRSSHYLGVGSKEGTVVLWNLKSKSRKKTFSVTDSSISHISFSHNDSHIAASSKGNVYLLSTMNNSVGGPHKVFDNHAITEVVYNMVKKSLLGCCSEGGSVSLFDTHTCKVIHAFTNAHASPVSSVSFSPVNELLMISVGYDKKFACYSIQTKKHIFTHKSSAPLTSAAFLPGYQHIALGAMTGQVFIHDLRTLRKPLATLDAHDKAVTNILLQPATKHLSEGSASDLQTASAKLRNKFAELRNQSAELSKKRAAASTIPSKSSEAPAQGASVESMTDSKPESPCATDAAADPSQASRDVLSAMLSPVRPSERITTANDEPGEENILGYDTVMDNVLSPVRSGDVYSSPSSNKHVTDMFQDIFSPVRTSQNADAPNNFQDVFSPVRTPTQNIDAPANLHDVSSPMLKNKAALCPDTLPSDKTLPKMIVCAEQDLPGCATSPQNIKQKENMDPKRATATPIASRKDSTRNSESVSIQKPLPKHILSPLHQIDDPKVNSHSPSNKTVKKHGIESLEPRLGLLSSEFSALESDTRRNQANAADAPATLETYDTLKPSEEQNDAPNILLQGTESGNGASHLQVELIRSCMSEVLEEFQDDVNRRMMHLQFVVTKQFLQMKESVQQLQYQHSRNDELILENEQLREENKRLKANF